MNYHFEKHRADTLAEKLGDAECACRLTVGRCQELEHEYMKLQRESNERWRQIRTLETENSRLRHAIEELAECPTLDCFE